MLSKHFVRNLNFNYLYENKYIPINFEIKINKPPNLQYFDFIKKLYTSENKEETFKKFYPKKKVIIPKLLNIKELYNDLKLTKLEYTFNNINIVNNEVLCDENNLFIINSIRNSELIILELLLLYAIDKLKNKSDRKFIGVFVLAQNDYFVYDCSVWNATKFIEHVNDTLLKIEERLYFYKRNLKYIGTHIPKDKKIFNSLIQSEYKYVQMFLSAPQSATIIKYDKEDIETSKEYIEKNCIEYFTHAPYIINLCNENIEWALNILKYQLKITGQIGGKGVVVHLGAKKNKKENDAIEIMFKNIESVVKYQIENKIECPLLLETSVGEGTEICWKLEDLINFYKKIISQYPEKYVKICCDTCHIYQAGYSPLFFIQELIKNKISIPLIHYNSSLYEKGEHKDRHAGIFEGMIGFVEMVDIIEFGIKNKIALVTE